MTTLTVLFDLDGTLIHSAPDVCRAVNHALAAEGLAPRTVEQVQGYLGFGARILIEKAVAACGVSPDSDLIERTTAAFLDDYRAHPVVDTKVFPGVSDAIAGLRARRARLAICTNKPSVTCGPVLDVLGLGAMFDAVVCGDQVANKKPHGDHIFETIAACDGSAAHAIMVGDSENDIGAARNAGIPGIAVSFGYPSGSLRDLGADAIIDHFDQLADAIDTVLAAS